MGIVCFEDFFAEVNIHRFINDPASIDVNSPSTRLTYAQPARYSSGACLIKILGLAQIISMGSKRQDAPQKAWRNSVRLIPDIIDD